jgi:hypothetical protein
MADPTEISLDLSESPSGDYDWKTNHWSYTPLYLGTYEGRTTGAAAPLALSGTMSADMSVSGVRSMKIGLTAANPGVTCGSAGYGGSITLPAPVPVGNTAWVRLRVFFPTNCALSHTWTSTNSGAVHGCGTASDDGNPTGTKFLAFSPNTGTSRIYTQIETSYRGAPLGFGRIQIEAGAGVDDFSVQMPKGQWFDLEMAVLVHQSAGFVRTWLNGVLIGERTNIRTVADGVASIVEFRLGDYFNGTPFNDGTFTPYFYVDDLIIATDVVGYGTPDGRDAANNPMIGAAPTLIDFQ